MELQERLSDFATAVGAKIKEVESNSGGGSGVQNVFIQDSEPTLATGNKALWLDTSNGDITFNLVIGD